MARRNHMIGATGRGVTVPASDRLTPESRVRGPGPVTGAGWHDVWSSSDSSGPLPAWQPLTRPRPEQL
eukprot:614113-Hanusia_phi.AAC.1